MTLGQIAYEAYANHTGWQAHDGQPILSWAELGETRPDIQAAWEAAAKAAGEPWKRDAG